MLAPASNVKSKIDLINHKMVAQSPSTPLTPIVDSSKKRKAESTDSNNKLLVKLNNCNASCEHGCGCEIKVDDKSHNCLTYLKQENEILKAAISKLGSDHDSAFKAITGLIRYDFLIWFVIVLTPYFYICRSSIDSGIQYDFQPQCCTKAYKNNQ